MNRKKQGENAIRIKTVLLRRGLSITDLAAEIGCSRVAASQAIHHGRFSRVVKKIEEALK